EDFFEVLQKNPVFMRKVVKEVCKEMMPCNAGPANPPMQGIISSQVPANEQGELQGALTSLMSATSIVGPLIMTQLFSYFTGVNAHIYFPGAPMLMGGIMTFISLLLAWRSLVNFDLTKTAT
ncbi:MAG: hypothetical protein ACKO96_43830, partial [Flammeovirgaceae bacterium]